MDSFVDRQQEKEDRIARIKAISARKAAEANKQNEQKKGQPVSDCERHEAAKVDKYYAEKAKKEAEDAQRKSDANILAALEELETGNLDKLTWGKALIAADGDEKRAKVEYLKTRKLNDEYLSCC